MPSPDGGKFPKSLAQCQRFHYLEIVAVTSAVCAIFAACIYDSRIRLFWLDEILTALPVGDPSLSDMLSALKDELNALPPFYFVAMWIWVRIVGVSELTLRLPSALFVASAILLLWLSLRRILSPFVGTLSAITLPLLCEPVRYNISEARCYGLYFAAYVAAATSYFHFTECTARHQSFRVVVTLSHAILVATHYIGGLFSASLVVAAFGSAQLKEGRDLRQYALSAMGGWIALVPAIPFFLIQRKLSGQYSWVPVPHIYSLMNSFSFGIDYFPAIVTLVIAAWLVATSANFSGRDDQLAGLRIRSTQICLFFLCNIALLVFAWIESRWGARIFLPRYLFPLFLCPLLLISSLLNSATMPIQLRPRKGETATCTTIAQLMAELPRLIILFALSCLLIGGAAVRVAHGRQQDESNRLRAQLSACGTFPQYPVVSRNVHDYACHAYYRNRQARVYMLTDEVYNGTPTGLRVGLALERHYFPETMTTMENVIRSRRPFFAIDADGAIAIRMKADLGWEGREVDEQLWVWQPVAHSDGSE